MQHTGGLVSAELHQLTFPGAILERGFWLYVLEITSADGRALYYVGRTGDNSSLNAQSPFARLSGHLGSNRHANALRRRLTGRGIPPETCRSFSLVAYGPIFAENAVKDVTRHRRDRDTMAALQQAVSLP